MLNRICGWMFVPPEQLIQSYTAGPWDTFPWCKQKEEVAQEADETLATFWQVWWTITVSALTFMSRRMRIFLKDSQDILWEWCNRGRCKPNLNHAVASWWTWIACNTIWETQWSVMLVLAWSRLQDCEQILLLHWAWFCSWGFWHRVCSFFHLHKVR